MIGQKELIKHIDSLIDAGIFPKFSIVVGQQGSGKTLVVDHICDKLNGIKLVFGKTVEDVRNAIEECYRLQSDCVVCVFDNVDTMSLSAKNALLKIVEEPPKNVRFIMTLTDINNTLETIQSRAQIFTMQPYTPTEIGEYAQKYKFNSAEMGVIADLCEVPGEVDRVHDYGVIAFDEFIQTVVDNVAEVSGANCFKIGNRINFKEDATLYDLQIFFKAFISECCRRLHIDVPRYSDGIKITSKALQTLRVNGIVKQNLFDIWLLDIRKAWMTE